ncbi:MAG: hypothetical protein AAB874_04515 [Patescibacteria group bacterium]
MRLALKNFIELIALYSFAPVAGFMGLLLIGGINSYLANRGGTYNTGYEAMGFVMAYLIIILVGILVVLGLIFIIWWIQSIKRKKELYFFPRYRYLFLLPLFFVITAGGWLIFNNAKNNTYYNQIVSARNISLCDDKKLELKEQVRCKAEILAFQESVSCTQLVKGITDKYLFSTHCINAIAIRRNDYSLCYDSEECLVEIAMNKRDSNICDNLKRKNLSSLCRKAVFAFQTLVVSGCPLENESFGKLCREKITQSKQL